jgi:hypothetical protein
MFRQLRIGRPVDVWDRTPTRRLSVEGYQARCFDGELLLLTLAIPIRIAEALDTLVPLPMTIYGFLLDSATGQGVQGAG